MDPSSLERLPLATLRHQVDQMAWRLREVEREISALELLPLAERTPWARARLRELEGEALTLEARLDRVINAISARPA